MMLAALSLCLATTLPSQAQLRGGWETFSSMADADEWTVYDEAAGDIFFPQWTEPEDGGNPDIAWAYSDDSAVWFYANPTVANGAFTGDFAAARIAGIEMDVYIDDLDIFSDLDFYIRKGTTGPFYFSESFLDTDFDSPGYYVLTVTFDEPWFFRDDEADAWVEIELTDAILGDIAEVGVRFYPKLGNTSPGVVAIDNVKLVPELILPEPTVVSSDGSVFRMTFPRGAGQDYSVLRLDGAAWKPVEGHENLTGSTPYQFESPVIPPGDTFKVETDPFYTEARSPSPDP